MLSFKSFINRDLIKQVDEEIEKFGFSEQEFYDLGALILERKESLATHHQPVDIKSKTMADVARGAHMWHRMKQGAHDYFSASEHEQHKMHHEANKVRKSKLFTNEKSNPKLAKSGHLMPHFDTKGLFLAPSTASGVDVCPSATKECKASCLGAKSGRAVMASPHRIKKTHFMIDHPHHFYAKLDHEITSAKTAAHKRGQKLAVRLNGTSDIPHEHLAPQLFHKHHDVQFYDYTKVHGRAQHANMPKNYHLTTSSSGLNHHDSNWKSVRKHLDKGGVASMVFHSQTGIKGKREAGPLPSHVHDEETGKKYRVVDGDIHDHRHLDHDFHGIHKGEGIIAGLRLKGGKPNVKSAGNFAVHHEAGIAVAKKGMN